MATVIPDLIAPSNEFLLLEEAIVERLAPLQQQGLRIINDPAAGGKVTFKAQAEIFLNSASFESSGAGNSYQQSQYSYTIALSLTDQRTHANIYPYLSDVRKLLQGFKPAVPGAARFLVKSAEYVPYESTEGMRWQYSMSVAIALLQR